MAASKGTIQNNPSKSHKFPRETYEPEFRYSLTIGFTFPNKFAHQSETYHDTNHESINFRFWSLFNLKQLNRSLYLHLQSFKPQSVL